MKYYVESGEMKRVVIASDPKEAVKIAIEQDKPESLGLLAVISERGFDTAYPDDYYILTPAILLEMYLISQDDYNNMVKAFTEDHNELG